MANQSGGETETGNTEALTETTDNAAAELREGAKAMRDTAVASGERLKEEAEARWQEGEASLEDMITRTEFAVIDHPLAAVGIAFAAGWVTSRLFR